MYFKAMFDPPLYSEEGLIENSQQNYLTGAETVKFLNHEFEIIRNNDQLVEVITFCNQCVNTFDIESVFIQLLLKVSNDQTNITLYESDGLVSDYSYEELMDFLD